MAYGIRCMGFADGRMGPKGLWLKSYNPEAYGGRGAGEWTANADEAMRFAEPVEAFKCWTAVPTNLPTRPDGLPNKPLTAFTVEVVALPVRMGKQ